MYCVMMPFWESSGGGVQVIERVLESTADSVIFSGEEVGTAEWH